MLDFNSSMMDVMDINRRIAQRVRDLRRDRGLTLDALAERAGMSRSNISLIERHQSSPTATALDKLATGLGVTVASLFELPASPAAPPSPVSRAAEQPCWSDPGSGYVRRNVSPPLFGSPIQLVAVVFPPGRRVAFETAEREGEIHQQIWILEGTMEVTVDQALWRLEAGDCLAMRLDCPIVYRNPTPRDARYLVALVNLEAAPRRATR